MKTVHLHGYAARYGEKFELDIRDPREAMRALAVQIPGFEKMIRDGEWHVVRGPLELQDSDDEERLNLQLAEGEQIHILPAIRGAGGGAMQVIVGIVLIAAALLVPAFAPYATAMIAGGAGLMVGGIIQMTMKIPGADTNSSESIDARASFLFSGPKNRSTQGVAIPRGYGRCRVGSVVISAGIYAEELTA